MLIIGDVFMKAEKVMLFGIAVMLLGIALGIASIAGGDIGEFEVIMIILVPLGFIIAIIGLLKKDTPNK